MEHDDKIKIENHNTMTNCNVFTGPVYGGVFPLPGSQSTINNYYGCEKPSQQPVEENVPIEEQEETPEDRTKRKEDVLRAITSFFNFEEKCFCRDENGKRITNERLAILFRRCFGLGAHPSRELLSVIDTLWGLLIDKRNQCFKNPNEDYYRQTVLNVLGYYKEKGVICGNKLELTRSVFEDADDNLSKNIERGISSNVFPAKTSELLDLYIDKLKKGEY